MNILPIPCRALLLTIGVLLWICGSTNLEASGVVDSTTIPEPTVDSLPSNWAMMVGAGIMLVHGRRVASSPALDISLQRRIANRNTSIGASLQLSVIGTVPREEERPGGTMVLGGIVARSLLSGTWSAPVISAGFGMFWMLYSFRYAEIRRGLFSVSPRSNSTLRSGFGPAFRCEINPGTVAGLEPWICLQIAVNLVDPVEVRGLYSVVVGVRTHWR